MQRSKEPKGGGKSGAVGQEKMGGRTEWEQESGAMEDGIVGTN